MIGQTRLQNTFAKYNLHTLPTTMLLIGEAGCGKHYFVNYLSKKFLLPVVDLSKPVKANYTSDDEYNTARTTWTATILDSLKEAKLCGIPKFYLIDLDSLPDTRDQTRFLKFIEEPGAMNYIILLSSSEAGLLDTILNRCSKFYFDNYTNDELRAIVPNIEDLPDNVFSICTTPGQFQKVDASMIDSLLTWCQSIITNISQASYANIVAQITKINVKDDYNKYDFLLFLKALKYVAFESYVKKGNKVAYNIYTYTCEYMQKPYNSKEAYMLNFLSGLAFEVRQ